MLKKGHNMKNIQARITRKRLNFLDWVKKIAPNSSIGEASGWSDEIAESLYNEEEASCALLILAMELGGMGTSGTPSPEVLEKIKNNKRLHWALAKACHLHAGIACSPFSGGVERFNKDMDQWANDEDRKRKLLNWGNSE